MLEFIENSTICST